MSVHKFLVPSQPSWWSLVTGRMVRGCDCGYLTTTALALKHLFLILPSGCLSFSRVMASKLVPRLSLLSFFLHCEFLFRPHISKNYQRLGCFLLPSLIFSCTCVACRFLACLLVILRRLLASFEKLARAFNRSKLL